jgi:hypothetical protein
MGAPDGRIPKMIRMNEQALLHQSEEALHQWIERVRSKEMRIDALHRASNVPSPDNVA